MRTIMGVLHPSRGTIRFDGRPIDHLPPYEIARLGIGYVPEGQGIFGTLTVDENLRVARLADDAESARRLAQVLDLFPDLERFRHARAATLSGGQQQMLAIARGLMARPSLMLLDEPSLGLSPLLVKEIFSIVRRLNRERSVTMMLVEQNARAALELADYGYVMELGRIVMADTADRLLASRDVQEFYLGVQDHSPRGSKRWKQKKTWR